MSAVSGYEANAGNAMQAFRVVMRANSSTAIDRMSAMNVPTTATFDGWWTRPRLCCDVAGLLCSMRYYPDATDAAAAVHCRQQCWSGAQMVCRLTFDSS